MDITYAHFLSLNIIGWCAILFLMLAARKFKKVFKEIANFWTSDIRTKELSFLQLITAILFTSNLAPQSIVYKKMIEKVGIYLIPFILLVFFARLGLADKLEDYFLNNTEFGDKIFMGKDVVERTTNPFGWKNSK